MELHLKPPQESWSRRQSLVMLQESSLTAVSNIVSTKDNSRKVFKVVVLLVCLTGFFYQAATFFTYYFKYPTIVDIQLENPDVIEMPAITFCNSNG
ncbi:uncharacterized protein CEXT_541891 [Caerostris extrusa]|uniref:Uncharacterized protein n=1 Tax=Caerostris extrusa TaxID=172846 RepID=A0AAV4TKP2_CAEEX|nr:uncharacterized protein CEXT_541891 [Caerostris extrusa]